MAEARKWCLNSSKKEIKYEMAMAMTKLGKKTYSESVTSTDS